MAVAKSPFYIIEDFLSPKHCESIIYDLDMYIPDYDPDGNPIKTNKHNDKNEEIIYKRFETIIPELEKYYGFSHRGTEKMFFEMLAEGVKPIPRCENSKWINKKWVRVRDRDFTVILFLSDYNENPPFDNDYEVYGGKLEFLQHGFGFNPNRGTLIVFPSGPHFINAYSEIFAGNLFLVKFHIAASLPYLYDPENFPGNYKTWFNV